MVSSLGTEWRLCDTEEAKKGFSQSGEVAYAVFFLSSVAQLRQKQQIQLSSIFVLKTSQIHLKSVSLLGREMQSILTVIKQTNAKTTVSSGACPIPSFQQGPPLPKPSPWDLLSHRPTPHPQSSVLMAGLLCLTQGTCWVQTTYGKPGGENSEAKELSSHLLPRNLPPGAGVITDFWKPKFNLCEISSS